MGRGRFGRIESACPCAQYKQAHQGQLRSATRFSNSGAKCRQFNLCLERRNGAHVSGAVQDQFESIQLEQPGQPHLRDKRHDERVRSDSARPAAVLPRRPVTVGICWPRHERSCRAISPLAATPEFSEAGVAADLGQAGRQSRGRNAAEAAGRAGLPPALHRQWYGGGMGAVRGGSRN